MSATATSERTEAAGRFRGTGTDTAERLFEPRAGSVSLDDVIVGTWDELVGSGSAACPVCRRRMRRASGCESCGSDLS